MDTLTIVFLILCSGVVGTITGYLVSDLFTRSQDPQTQRRLEQIDRRIIRLQGDIIVHHEDGQTEPLRADVELREKDGEE